MQDTQKDMHKLSCGFGQWEQYFFSLLQITVLLHDDVLVSVVHFFVLMLHGISCIVTEFINICDLALFFFSTDISRMLLISSCAHISAS